MPLDSVEFRTSLKKLLVGLILILVPLTVVGLYAALQGETYIRQMNGEHFRLLTRTSADYTSEFVGGMACAGPHIRSSDGSFRLAANPPWNAVAKTYSVPGPVS